MKPLGRGVRAKTATASSELSARRSAARTPAPKDVDLLAVTILGRSSSRDEVIDDHRLGVQVICDVKQCALDNRAEASKSHWPFRRIKRGPVDE